MGWLDMAWARAVQGQKRLHDASGRVTGRAKPDSLVVLLVMWKKCEKNVKEMWKKCERKNKSAKDIFSRGSARAKDWFGTSHAAAMPSPTPQTPPCQDGNAKKREDISKRLDELYMKLQFEPQCTSDILRHPPTFPKFQPLFQLFLYCFCIVSVPASVVSVFSAGLALSQGRPIEDRLLSKGAAFCSEAFNLGHNLGQLL